MLFFYEVNRALYFIDIIYLKFKRIRTFKLCTYYSFEGITSCQCRTEDIRPNSTKLSGVFKNTSIMCETQVRCLCSLTFLRWWVFSTDITNMFESANIHFCSPLTRGTLKLQSVNVLGLLPFRRLFFLSTTLKYCYGFL